MRMLLPEKCDQKLMDAAIEYVDDYLDGECEIDDTYFDELNRVCVDVYFMKERYAHRAFTDITSDSTRFGWFSDKGVTHVCLVNDSNRTIDTWNIYIK